MPRWVVALAAVLALAVACTEGGDTRTSPSASPTPGRWHGGTLRLAAVSDIPLIGRVDGRPDPEAGLDPQLTWGSVGWELLRCCLVRTLFAYSGQPGREEDMDAFLEWLAPWYEGDWWFDTVKAFSECETGRPGLARARIERSLEANVRNAHGAHVKAHVLYELHEDAEAMRFLDAWMPGCGKQALMHCHLSWHLAVTAFALGQSDRAWQVYREHVHPGGAWGPPINIVSDSAAFLWRAELAGAARKPELWRDLRDYSMAAFPKVGVFFADVHAALALVATGDADGLQRLVTALRERVAAGRLPPGEVVPNLVEAFGAYGAGDWNGAIRLLEKALPETVRIGGSRAQRDIVAKTLFAAYLKAGRPEDAGRMARH